MKKKIKTSVALFIFSLSLAGGLFAQSPYELNWKKEGLWLGLAGTGDIAAIFIAAGTDDLSAEAVAGLDKNDINSFDRGAVNNNSIQAQDISDVVQYTSYALPSLFLINKRIRKDYLTLGVMGIEAFLTNAAFTSLTKLTVKRVRPFVYNPDIALEDKTRLHSRMSFYSGHTSTVATLSFFSAKVFNDYFPESKWKPVVWSVAAALPAVNGYLRVKGGKHFPTDVITGYVAGGLVGFLVPHFHKKKNKDKDKKVDLSLFSGGESLGLMMTW